MILLKTRVPKKRIDYIGAREIMARRNYSGFRLKHAIVTSACGLVAATLLGCQTREVANDAASQPVDTPNGYSLDSVLDSLGSGIRGVSSNVGPQAEALHSATKEELAKLFQWEYRVVDLAIALSAEEFEAKLAELGADGWECFSINTLAESSRVSCKRHPPSAISYLKYVPGL
jgi:hypothetical protein